MVQPKRKSEMTANHTSFWNQWRKSNLVHHSTKQDAFFEFLYMQIIYEASFRQTWKAKRCKYVVSPPLYLPLHQQTELWDLDHDSEVWAFWVKGHFFKHHLSNLFQCMMFLQLVSSFVFLLLWLFDCPLRICSTWKSPLLVRMQQTVIKWSLTTCTLLM